MNDSRRTTSLGAVATAVAWLVIVGAGLVAADGPELKLRAQAIGAGGSAGQLTIELFRWSTEAERTPLLVALSAPPPAPPAASPPPASPPAGRAAAAGRGGRGGRAAAPPASPMARLTSAVKAAPTLGFIWGDGVTGYSIKYAWRASSSEGTERVVLVTDRRLGAHTALVPPSSDVAADAEFTVIEMRLDAKGAGEAKASLTTGVIVDAAAKTLALDGYDRAPLLLKVTR